MSQENEQPKPADNMERLKQEAAACGSGCSCHAPGTTAGKTRWVVGAIILIAAGALAGRALLKSAGTAPKTAAPAFAAQPATATAATTAAATQIDIATVPQEDKAVTAAPAAGTPADSAKVASTKTEPGLVVGREIAAFADLNTVATDTNAVFVFLPAKTGEPGKPPTAQMEGAARTITEKGNMVGLFTLKTDSPDYAQITGQMTLPAVLALVKGRGMKAVSGEITETKLVQGYIAALNAGGGCGAGGCGPASAGCK